MKHIFLFFMALFFFAGASARTWNVEKITPPSWWAGMNHPELQILLYGEDISSSEVTLEGKGIHLKKPSARTIRTICWFISISRRLRPRPSRSV